MAVVDIIGVEAAMVAVAASGLGGDRAALERDGVTGIADDGVGMEVGRTAVMGA